jgi:hypothetical protein
LTPRTLQERKLDALAKLEIGSDLWIATSAPGGAPYLVPLSFAWNGELVTIATPRSMPTMQNLLVSRSARIALGDTRDVVMLDVVLDRVASVAETPVELRDRYAAQAGWSPSDAAGDYLYALLRPERIQVWREADELPGRTVMRRGSWAV